MIKQRTPNIWLIPEYKSRDDYQNDDHRTENDADDRILGQICFKKKLDFTYLLWIDFGERLNSNAEWDFNFMFTKSHF